MKKIFLTSLIILLLFSCGCTWFSTGADKVFEKAGMKLTLTDEFQEENMEGFTVCYSSSKVAVLCIKEPFETNPDFVNLSEEDYMNLVRETNSKLAPSAIEKIDGLVSITYTVSGKESYDYFTVAYKAPDGFWLLQFCSRSKDYQEQKTNILKWAKAVRFEGQAQ